MLKTIDEILGRLRSAAEKLQEGFYEDAVDGFASVIALTPAEPEAFRGRGTALLRLKDWAGAEKDFRMARALNASDPENGMGLALCLAAMNRVYDAVDAYDQVLAWRPDHVPAYVQLGLLHFKLGAVAKGRDYMKEALARRPTPDQRRIIESSLAEQAHLDKNRYYRPDFHRLKAQDASAGLASVLRRAGRFLMDLFPSRKKEDAHGL